MTKTHRHTPLQMQDVEPHMCGIDLRLQILSRVPFFAPLSHREVAEINKLFREYGYEAGENIYFAGDPATRLCVVASGRVKLVRHSLSGQDVLLDILAPGEFFGSLAALGDEAYAETAQAQTTCCVLAVGAEAFQAILARYPAVALKVLEIVAARLRSAHATVQQLSAQPIESRVAAVLLKLAEKLGEERDGEVLIQVPLSRQDLAGLTGTTTETVSRIMSSFRKAGLIRSGRQWVAIADHERLADLAEEAPS